jgi:hypothetical protein
MIFVGDIASPDKRTTLKLLQFFEKHTELYGKQTLVGNLEGLLSDRNPKADREPLLSNDPALPSALKGLTAPVFCLANNHVLDLPGDFRSSVKLLKEEGIPFCGAGLSAEEAGRPVFFKEGGGEIFLFNACWDFLLYNQKNPSLGVYVEEINERKLLEDVSSHKDQHPEASLVVYLHWSLDLESLPFPMYRQFSRALIDAGASLVVGTHSHCVQGGEKYGDGYILYGLGNFLLPDNEFAGGRLKFPAFAKLELALEWNIEKNRLSCHWYEYQTAGDNHHLEYLGTDDFESSERLRALSPYRGMDDHEYIRFFKKNRRKKILIPVYRDYRRKHLNKFYTSLLKMRARTAHFLASMNFIKWQN